MDKGGYSVPFPHFILLYILSYLKREDNSTIYLEESIEDYVIRWPLLSWVSSYCEIADWLN
jgi:hypothetical protein